MGNGCGACKSGDIHSPKGRQNANADWQNLRPTNKSVGRFADPKDFFRSSRDVSRQNSSHEDKPREDSKPVEVSKSPRTQREDFSEESWIAVPRRDNSIESIGKSHESSGGGILLEFRPKNTFLPSPSTREKKSSDSPDVEGNKGLTLRRLLTPCSDQQNETASFGERRQSEDYLKQSPRVNDQLLRMSSKDGSTKSLARAHSLFSNSESVATVTKCNPPPSDTHQGKVGQQSETNDSMTMQRGSSLNIELFQKPFLATPQPPNKNREISVIKEEAEIKEREETTGRFCQRIVKVMDQDKLSKLRNFVYKNILKQVPPIVGLSDPKETNTKGDALNSISISPINDGANFNSSLAACWDTSSIDHLADIMKGQCTPQVIHSNKNKGIKDNMNSTFTKYMLKMPRRHSEFANKSYFPLSQQEESLNVTETGSVITKKNEDGNKFINQYMIISGLGRGSYGVVKLCFDTISHKQVAMKIMNKTKLKRLFVARQTTAYKLLETEIAIMKKMNHPNIVKLYEIIDDPGYNKLFIVMEYISGGSLHSLVKDGEPIPLDKCWKYFRDLLNGLEYCHEAAGIVHRDIKPENLLIDKDDVLKIVDFGVAFMITDGSDESKVTLGSTFYLAPEICKGIVYKGRRTDIWAAGVTLYRMLTTKFPFEGTNVPGIYKSIINNEPTYPAAMPADLKDLLMRMLQKDESKRITLAEIKNHTWVTRNGRYPMELAYDRKIVVTDMDKLQAISTFPSVFAMTKLRMVFKKHLKRIKAKLMAKKMESK